MSKAESAAWPEEQPGEASIVPFVRPEQISTGPEEYEIAVLRGLFSEDNVRFILEKARESGVDFREILDKGIESYAELYEIYENGRPLHYLGTDGKMHPIDDGDKPLQAS